MSFFHLPYEELKEIQGKLLDAIDRNDLPEVKMTVNQLNTLIGTAGTTGRKHYSIIRADDAEGLESLVNSAIEEGFTPLGPPKYLLFSGDEFVDGGVEFMQAVYKPLDVDEKV